MTGRCLLRRRTMVSSKVASCESSEAVLSVQEHIKKPLTSVPQRYIHNHEPSASQDKTLCHTIPTINLKKLIHGEATELELARLHSACKDWGFFQLVDHGISPLVLETLKDEIEGFFRIPLEEKMKYKIRAGDVEGYGAVIRSEDQTLDWGDRLFMITNPLSRRKPHLFPELSSSLRNILESYIVEVQNVAMTFVVMLGKALEIEKKEWEERFEDGMQSVRMTYYPPCPQPELVMGLTAHSDATGITILNQMNGVNGLQIKKDGIWIPVSVSSNALVVNVGDILEIMSNGLYKSVEHRVTVNSEKERISIAMFFAPKFESEIGPAVSLTNGENVPHYKKVKMEKYVQDFFARKLDGKSYLEHMKIRDESLILQEKIDYL
ncbi:protein SRG1-like [Abrus precatorius]|uniref:Protein SRG1-like n=1 Tax=Abrus precatorius TaxID=3816 RepID=A0A8B8K4B9_ABRPR|nr:protein SRG1-like [Abrus precatorius]